MKYRNLFSFLFVFGLIFLLVGCKNSVENFKKGFSESIESKESLENYLQTMDNLNQSQNTIEGNFMLNYINVDDFDNAYIYLTQVGLPQYDDFVSEVKLVETYNNELKEIHKIYINASELGLQRLQTYKEGMELNDESKFNRGNELLEQSNLLFEEYRKKMVEYSSKTGIPLEYKEFIPK